MSTADPPGESRLTPVRIAAIYLLAGGTWILLSDQAVAALPIDRTTATSLQTIKGWLFVGLSAVLVYALVERGRRELRESNRRLRTALQHSSVLHRVLRHNLRNTCNVIALCTEELADRVGGTPQAAGAIEQRVDDLLALSEKSKHLRQVTQGDQERVDVDVDVVVEREVAAFLERHPRAEVAVDCPSDVSVRAYPKLEVVVGELLENAFEHGAPDGGDLPAGRSADGPTVEIDVREAGDEIVLEVADEGPGFPEMERTLLERDVEEPLSHSRGVGLWVVRTIVTASGGELEVLDDEPTGTVVRVRLPVSGRAVTPAAHRQTV